MFSEVSPKLGSYLAGFVDGEGSFNVSFRRRKDYKNPWKISLCFNVSQRDPTVLIVLKDSLGCGTMRQRLDGCWYYEVNTFKAIAEHVIPFFEKFPFLSNKKIRDFAKFKEMASLIKQQKHLTSDGINEILKLRSDMNDGGKRKYSEEYIKEHIENPQRLHAKHLNN